MIKCKFIVYNGVYTLDFILYFDIIIMTLIKKGDCLWAEL